MIARIENIDNTNFNLNGIPYFKLFIPVEVGNNAIKIVSVYDSDFNLLPSTNISDIEVDNIAYSSVALLMDALKNVVFNYLDTSSEIARLENLIQINKGNANETGGATTLSPTDARLSLDGQHTGAIKIRLPQSFSSTMMTLFIEVFEYSIDECFSLRLGGYNHSSGSWINTSSGILGQKTDRNFTVRFGHDGTKWCIYVGELNSRWSYPKIVVTNGIFSFSSSDKDSWLTGWQISLETASFQNITTTHTNSLPVSK